MATGCQPPPGASLSPWGEGMTGSTMGAIWICMLGWFTASYLWLWQYSSLLSAFWEILPSSQRTSWIAPLPLAMNPYSLTGPCSPGWKGQHRKPTQTWWFTFFLLRIWDPKVLGQVGMVCRIDSLGTWEPGVAVSFCLANWEEVLGRTNTGHRTRSFLSSGKQFHLLWMNSPLLPQLRLCWSLFLVAQNSSSMGLR